MKGRELGCAVAAATAAMLLSDVDQLGRDDGNDLHAATDAFLLAEERGFPDAMRPRVWQLAWHGPPAQGVARSAARRCGGRAGGPGAAPRDTTLLAQCLLAAFPGTVLRNVRPAAKLATQRPAAKLATATMVGGRGLILRQRRMGTISCSRCVCSKRGDNNVRAPC